LWKQLSRSVPRTIRSAAMPVSETETALLDKIRSNAHVFSGHEDADFAPIMDLIGDAHFVLIGEASHGTHEFYRIRAALTRKLIREKGFTAVAVEADWPDAYRVNRYVRHESSDKDANEALQDFQRFPRWMWRNTVVTNFIDWMHAHNAGLPPEQRAGFYGLDLYSLFQSMSDVLEYLEGTDQKAAERARNRYACFDHCGEDPQSYGYCASMGLTKSCEDEAVSQLRELHKARLAKWKSEFDEEFFSAEMNARLVADAERYYRTMFSGRVSSWNVRDSHMSQTLETLNEFLNSRGRDNKIVVWAHNSHLGNAKATDMGRDGELNIGQLTKEKHGDDAVLLGFTTHTGKVTAADNWDGAPIVKRVKPSLPNSYERLFHDTELSRFFLRLKDSPIRTELSKPRLERAIGVIYRPDTERMSHYFNARLAEQFDGVMHIEHTNALRPLEWTAPWTEEDLPETYPFGL